MTPAAQGRAARQRRERFTRKRSESAARDIWAALIVKAATPNWNKFATILRGIQTPQCACVQCAAESMLDQSLIEAYRHAKKAF